ncbi:MAG TPA: hypothetical protein VFP22_10355, partial [Candidatus Limnocylindrales bacterium]|nr:hypothetical protein [Candidatus Limnocylindrales bacterium]
LSDPDLRARYDRERRPRRAREEPTTPGAPARATRRWNGSDRPAAAPTSTRRHRRPVDAEEALARHLDRVERLTPDEIDRMTLAETPPIAFVASIARFLSPDLLATLESVEGRVHERLPRAVRWNRGVRDSAVGFGQEIVLSAFLDEHLSGDFRERVRERLTRGWSAAVDQPRYGPNGAAVAAAIARLRSLPPAALRDLLANVARTTEPGRGGPPWPPGLRPDEDDALRVSSELARLDAVAAVPGTLPRPARRSLERAMHGLVLHHAFPAATFDALVGPWRTALGVDDGPRSGVRSDRRPRG